MDSHDESLDEPRPDRAETESLLRGIGLAAVPQDRDSLLWACGYEAGRAAESRATPTAGRRIRAWLPLVTSTAAAFFIGFFSSGALSVSPTVRDGNSEVAIAPPSATAPATPAPPRSAPAVPRLKRPREGLYASVPLNRLDELLAAPSVPPELRGVTPPPDRPPLRVRDGFSRLDSIDL